MDKKQHIYEVCVEKREYHYMNVRANNREEAEEIVIELILDNPDETVLGQYLDDSECEVTVLDRVKTPSKAHKTIN